MRTPGTVSQRKGALCAFFCVCTLLILSRAWGAGEPPRWFMPGPLGFEPPLPAGDKGQASSDQAQALPAGDGGPTRGYLTRAFAGLDLPEERAWAVHNGLTPPLMFSHNLSRVFPPSLYEEHPDFFPLVAGTRLRPTGHGPVIWQPNLGSPAVAAYAARCAEEFFASNPEAKSFSLGVNDALVFGESPATLALVSPGRWFRQRPDYSNLVFTFMNRTASEVAERYPDRLLGCLAYYWCENTPSFPVRPNVMPFLTADRSQGYDPKFWQEELNLQDRWGRAGPQRLGLYDYLEGRGYLIPHIFTHLVAENLRHARRAGFTDYYGEAFPNWGLDGPQPWLVAQLLQNPQQSSRKLLNEYYARFFGPSARPMRRFFERCEEQWMGQPGPAEWLKYFRDEAQAALFPSPVCRELRELLDRAAKAAIGQQRYGDRVRLIGDAFGLTERLVAAAEAENRLAGSVLRAGAAAIGRHEVTAAELLDQLDQWVRARAEFRRYAAWLVHVEPLAVRPFEEDDYFRSDPDSAAVWAALDAADAGGPGAMPATLRRLAANPEYAAIVIAWQQSRIAAAVQVVNRNASLEGPAAPGPAVAGLAFGFALPADWVSRAEPSENFTAVLMAAAARTGRQGLRIRGAEDAALYQWVPAVPGAVYRARVAVRGQVSAWTKVQVTLGWLDAAQQHLGGALTMRVPTGSWSEWVEPTRIAVAPSGARWVGIGLRVQHQPGDDWLDVDDLKLEMIPATAVRPP